jgi:DNA recombination protein RmuC
MTLIYILLTSLLLVSSFIAWKVLAPKELEDDAEAKMLREMIENLRKEVVDSREKQRTFVQERMDKVSDMLQRGMTDSTRTLQSQFKDSASILQKVTEKLTKLDETNKQVLGFSEQLKDLEMILKQPKGKGALGEYWLESMLGHVLAPGQYKMQHTFEDGEIVDAAVFFQEKIIPIDAKFTTEHYTEIMKEKDDGKRAELEKIFKNALKQRIEETSKYIRPSENTTDFAFMFIPAEGIFYDVLVNTVGTVEVNKKNLMEYAFGKHVIIVSPATFFAYLQTVLQGLKAFRMQEDVLEIKKNVEQLGKHLNSYDSFMQKMGGHLGTTVSMYNQSYAEFKKIDKDVYKLTDGAAGGTIDPLTIERPTGEAEAEGILQVASKKFAEVAKAAQKQKELL